MHFQIIFSKLHSKELFKYVVTSLESSLGLGTKF